MNPIPYILNRMAFVRVEFAPDGSFRTQVFLWRPGGIAPAERVVAQNMPAVVVACGHGVVTKPDGTEPAARVKADAGTFLCCTVAGQTSFVRRERLQAVQAGLAADGCVPVAVYCADAAADFGQTAGILARQFRATLGWRMLLRLTPEASAVSQALVRRLGFPVLGLFLLLLAANAVFSPRLNARRQALQAELAIRERTASGAASADARQRKLLAEFTASPGVSRAILCDRVARAVPARVVLTSLEVEPLARRFEAGKPLQRREGVVLLGGAAPAAADVSAFVQRLAEAACCRDVRLTHVEKERDGDRLAFRIEIAL